MIIFWHTGGHRETKILVIFTPGIHPGVRGRDYYLRSLALNCVNAVLNAVYAVYILRFESAVYYAVYISLYQFLRSLRSLFTQFTQFTQFLRSLRSLFTQFTPGNPKKYTRLETQYTQYF